MGLEIPKNIDPVAASIEADSERKDSQASQESQTAAEYARLLRSEHPYEWLLTSKS